MLASNQRESDVEEVRIGDRCEGLRPRQRQTIQACLVHVSPVKLPMRRPALRRQEGHVKVGGGLSSALSSALSSRLGGHMIGKKHTRPTSVMQGHETPTSTNQLLHTTQRKAQSDKAHEWVHGRAFRRWPKAALQCGGRQSACAEIARGGRHPDIEMAYHRKGTRSEECGAPCGEERKVSYDAKSKGKGKAVK